MTRKFALLMSKMESTWKHIKILLMDFSSTASCNINWVHSFDLSQLPLKTAVLSVASLSSLLIHNAAQTHLCAQIFSVSMEFQSVEYFKRF